MRLWNVEEYPDVIQFLQQATAKRSTQSRLAFDAIPTEFDGRLSVSREVVNRNQDTKEEDDQSEGDERETIQKVTGLLCLTQPS